MFQGFVPRVSRNTKAGLARAVSLPESLIGDTAVVPAAAIVDAISCSEPANLIADLSNRGTTVLVDNQVWRFAYLKTFDAPKWLSTPYADLGRFDGTEEKIRAFVSADLRVQESLGASAYLLPDWFAGSEEIHAAQLRISFDEFNRELDRHLKPAPVVQYLAIPRAREWSGALVSGLNAGLSAVIAQLSPCEPLRDSVDLLAKEVRILLDLRRSRIPVIGGHLAALGPTLLALGIDGVDAGLATDEAFSASSKVSASIPRKREGKQSGGAQGARMVIADIERTVDDKLFRTMMTDSNIAAEIRCRMSCCQFQGADLRQDRSIEHALRVRLRQASTYGNLSPAMALDKRRSELIAVRDKIARINAHLLKHDASALPTLHIANQIALLERFHSKSAAA
jgi:hypothetical protein